MHQFLHLLIVDVDLHEGLTSWLGGRWLLPMLSCSELARAGAAAQDWTAKRGLRGQVIGQWLGKLTPKRNGIDWLTLLRARRQQQPGLPPELSWVPLQRLKSSSALLDYQQWAVTKVTETDLPSVPGPFGTMTWPDEIAAWLAETGWPPTDERVVCHRATPSEVVCTFTTSRGFVHFKGLSHDRASEAVITAALSQAAPRSFVSTLALESRPGGATWWLTEHCPGADLASDLTLDRTADVVVACATVQEHLAAGRDGLALSCLLPADLSGAAAWAHILLGDDSVTEGIGCSDVTLERRLTALEHFDAALERISEATIAARCPQTWVPLDLDPTNVLLDGKYVRFIDLDRSYIGPAFLAFAILLRRVERRLPGPEFAGEARAALIQAYQNAWSRPLSTAERWPDFHLASALLEAYLGWQQVVALTARGELFDVLDFAGAQVARRLVKTADRFRPYDPPNARVIGDAG
jgi:hypothetical protein